MNNKLLLFLLFISVVEATQRKDYTGYKLLKVTPNTKHQLSQILELKKKWDSSVTGVYFWSESFGVGLPVLIQVSPGVAKHFIKQLKKHHLKVHITINNIQKVIDDQAIEREKKILNNKDEDFALDVYHTGEEINEYLSALADEYYDPLLTEYFPLATSIEGRSIMEFRMGSHTLPAILIECGIHSPEWITISTCLNIINDLVTNKNDPEIISLREMYSWYFIPVLNVDGYNYTWTVDRLWRKNRRPGIECDGVDLNRNFDINWGGEGSSGDECSHQYRGAHPFSEPETQIMQKVFWGLHSRLVAFWALHSIGQLYMVPHCYKSELPTGYQEMMRVVDLAVEAIENTHNMTYIGGNCADTIYVSSGVTTDYAYEMAQVFYASTIELRDTGEHGWVLPEDQIIPNYEEIWNGIKAALAAIPQSKRQIILPS